MDTSTIISSTPSQYEAMLNNYASIVEKTNNQLGLGINLATLAVTILSVLIATIAIFVAFALWKNSKEQRDRMIQFFSEQEKMINERNKKIEKLESRYDTLISEHEREIKTMGKKDKEKIKQIQEDIDELKNEKISASAYLQPASGLHVGSPLSGILGYKSMICSKCGKSFRYYNSPGITLPLISTEIVHCSYCGAINIGQ